MHALDVRERLLRSHHQPRPPLLDSPVVLLLLVEAVVVTRVASSGGGGKHGPRPALLRRVSRVAIHVVHLEAGESGSASSRALQVGVVGGEVAQVLLQHPHRRPLDAVAADVVAATRPVRGSNHVQHELRLELSDFQ